MTVGEIIAINRRIRGWTQKELAAILGVSHAAVSRWENGNRHPEPRRVAPLAMALGVPAEMLAQRTTPDRRSRPPVAA